MCRFIYSKLFSNLLDSNVKFLWIHLILIICEFQICKFVYSLNLFVTPKSILTVFSRSFTDIHSTMKNLCCLFLAEVTQGDALPSCFSIHTVNRCLFCSLFDAMFFIFCAFCWWFCDIKWSPRIVLKCRHEKAVICLVEETHVT